jgi:tetratricopeptide (TPR) repeat protein
VAFYLKWLILSRLMGSPLGALAVLIVGGFVVDRFTLGLLPRPLRGIGRWSRRLELRRILRNNPRDRRARFELADQLQRSRPATAMELLRVNLEAGDTDPGTLLVMAVACFRAHHSEQAEVFLREAIKEAPQFRNGALWLELGRGQLEAGDARGAVDSLRELLLLRPGSIEGKVLLGRALTGIDDTAGAAALRRQAWEDYRSAPLFQRREQRLWAYRAQPWRAVPWVLGLVLLIAIVWVWKVG